jgi:Cu-Zn family superoxide dismutase
LVRPQARRRRLRRCRLSRRRQRADAYRKRNPYVPAEIEAELIQVLELPGAAVYPESIGIDPATGDAYVGSLTDGSLYRLAGGGIRDGKAEIWSGAGVGGRTSVAGVKVDDDRRLWAAGGYDGTLWVYDLPSRALLARLDVGSRPSCVNDIAFADGGAYVTDSVIPRLFRASGDPPVLRAWSDLAAHGVPWPDGLNLNGIVVTADGRHLVSCQTTLGRFWRISLADGAVDEVALGGGPLPHCDGLARSGSVLYVAVNARNQLAVVDLADDGSGGTVRAIMTCEAFAFPTAVAVAADRLLVVNGQLDALGGTPRQPFTVAVVALPDAPARRPQTRS